LTVLLPGLRTISEANASQREHWATKHKRHKAQRTWTYYTLSSALGSRCPLTPPLTITLTRIAPRQLDEGDNLSSALKSVRDGVADYLGGTYGTGQDRQDGLTWRYAQHKGDTPRTYGVQVCFEAD